MVKVRGVAPRGLLLGVALAAMSCAPTAPRHLYRSDAFALTDSSVEQGPFRATATSRDRIESSYQRAATEVNFKFSINGGESEFPPGEDHMIYLRPEDGRMMTPVYTFGVLDPPRTPAPRLAAENAEEGPVDVTFRVDMGRVLAAWRGGAVYVPPNGPPIAAGEFEGLYVVGNVEPLSWDFGRLAPGSPFQLHDPDGDGVYEVTLTFDARFARPQTPEGLVVWERSRDLSRFPEHRSPHPLVDALHRLALEELLELRRSDGALDAGGRWPGVWTRDLAWSTLLALALVMPDEVRAGLLARLDADGRIAQDSGTGGSWPISTDRVSWALAAWELWAATGDRNWLLTAHEAIRRSAEADLAVAHDPATGLFRGESTFLDWREQSYPDWMDPKDIGTSQALGTNALHYGAYRVLARMARLLGEPGAERWDAIADGVRRGLDERLWQPDRGHYGAYLYGRMYPSLSPRPEMLGEALAVVLGAADERQARRTVSETPVVPFGVPSFWPYVPDQPPYHNAGVWPQVVGFRAWAAAEVGNPLAVEHALANLFRAAGLFLTNKENWVAATGHFEGTEVNSDRFQASAAAQLATVYRVLFGIRLHADRMELRPFVPEPYAGTRSLTGLRYRGATLAITLHGFGDGPREIRLDGRPVAKAEVPGDLTGDHTLEIWLNGVVPGGGLQPVENVAAPATPVIHLEGDDATSPAAQSDGELAWSPVSGAVHYEVHRNGRRIAETRETRYPASEPDGVAEYQVLAVDARGLRSFLSEPVRVGPAEATEIAEPLSSGPGEAPRPPAPRTVLPEPTSAGLDGAGYVRTIADENVQIEFRIDVPEPGGYAIDVRYANGAGPISYGHEAAARTLLVDGLPAGTLLMPQRGARRWDDWGYTNAVRVHLEPGPHTLAVAFRPPNRNLSATADEALVDHLRWTRLAE